MNKGQSLLEVVISGGVIAFILVALVSTISFSLSSLDASRNKTLATKYAQEGIEYIRSQRDQSWLSFSSKVGAYGSGRNYCISTFPAWSALVQSMTDPVCPVGSTIGSNTLFYREMVLENSSVPNQVNVKVTVRWAQGARTDQVTLDTYLTNW